MGDGIACLPGMRAVEASMPGKSTLTADAAERAGLRDLSKSEQRGEADRARAILLTLEGRKAEEIAAVLGVHPWTAPGAQGKNTASSANHGRVQPSIRPGVAARWPQALMIIRRSVPYHVSGLCVRCTQRVGRSSVRPDLPSTSVLPSHSPRDGSTYAASALLVG